MEPQIDAPVFGALADLGWFYEFVFAKVPKHGRIVASQPAMSASSIKPEQLRNLKCLGKLNDEERAAFLEFVEPASCEQNTVLFEEGSSGNCMYLILEGQMRVFTRKKGKIVPLTILEAGDAFGDIAMFHGTPRLASVDALRDTRLLKLTASGLKEMTAKCPDLSTALLSSLATSLSQMYQHFRH